MALKCIVYRFAANVGAGNQTITTADLDGQTPIAVFFTFTNATVDGTPANHAVYGTGAATSASDMWAMCGTSENGVGTTDTYRRATTDECILILDPTNGTVNGEAAFVSFVANGCIINWGNAPAAAYLIRAEFFAGSSVVAALADTFTMAAIQNNSVDVNTVGFEPDILLTAGHGYPFDDTTQTTNFQSHGLVINGDSVSQFCNAFGSRDAVTPSSVGAQISNAYGIAWCSTTIGALGLAGEFGSFDSVGFSCITRLAAASDSEAVGFLALKFSNVNFWGGTITTPTVAAIQYQNTVGFKPVFVHCAMTQMPAVNTAYNTAVAGSFGSCAFDSTNENSDSIQDEDAQGTSNTQSLSDNTAVNLPLDSGAAGFVAAFVNFEPAGWTWDFTAVTGTATQFWVLALGDVESVISAVSIVIPSHYQSNQLTIAVYKPTISSYIPAGTFLYNLSDTISSYSHTIQALGGYWSADFTINDRQSKLEDWLDGLGWHIEVYNPALVKIWEGFINEVTLGVGGFSVTRGPLMDIANRVTVWYSLLDTTLIPPTSGVSLPTTIIEDTTSQSKYGIVEKTLSVGSLETSDAEQIRDTFLAENAWPETGKSLNLGGAASEASISVNCLGYTYWLDTYPYSDNISGTRTITQKIQDIMGADPNVLFSTDYSKIATNNLLVPRYDAEERTAWAIIKALVARGDINDNRYTFGIYNDQVAYYDAIPTDIEYYQRLADPSQRVETPFGQWVKPWDVRAGKWLLFPDFLIGKIQPPNIRLDQRAMFIESLTYTMPWSLSLTGGKVGTLAQRLARLGLGGAGA